MALTKYSERILNRDLTRLEWLLSNDEGNDKEYTQDLKLDIQDLKSALKILDNQ